MEQDTSTLNDSHAVTAPKSMASEQTAVSPGSKVSLGINLNAEENEQGDSKPTTPSATTPTRPGQNKKKPETSLALRAPYAQPVLDGSKVESAKSTVEGRIASAKERRLQQQRQLELDLKSRREKEDVAHAKWVQSVEEKRQKIEENKMKDIAHRREVELRKKQQLEEDKKRAEAKIARIEQVYDVKIRQKRNSSSDRTTKRWSWGENNEQKSASQMNLSGPSSTKQPDRFSRSPLHMNISHMTFASGLRSYESQEKLTKGTSPGRPVHSGLTEPVAISPRLLAPTRASLARSKNATNDLDDSVSQSSGDSKSHGPMRSRSKDRRNKDQTASRPGSSSASPLADGDKSKPTIERKPTPTRGTSPMAPKRGPSPAASDTKKTAGVKTSLTGNNKAKKEKDPTQPRPLRTPSPAPKPPQSSTAPQTTPTRTTPKRAPSPVPAAKAGTKKVQNASVKAVSTPPSIKQSLRPASAPKMKPRSSPAGRQTAGTKPTGVKSAGTKSAKSSVTKSKPDTTKEPQKSKAPSSENATSNSPQGGATAHTTAISADTSQLGPEKEFVDKTSNNISEQEKQIIAEQKENTPPSGVAPESQQNPLTVSACRDVAHISVVMNSDLAQKASEIVPPDDAKSDRELKIVTEDDAMTPQNESLKNEPPSGDTSQPQIMAHENSSQNQVPGIHLAAESGFHLEDQEMENNTPEGTKEHGESQDSSQTTDPHTISPTDSLDDIDAEPELPSQPDIMSDGSLPDSIDSESDEEVISVKENMDLKDAAVDELVVQVIDQATDPELPNLTKEQVTQNEPAVPEYEQKAASEEIIGKEEAAEGSNQQGGEPVAVESNTSQQPPENPTSGQIGTVEAAEQAVVSETPASDSAQTTERKSQPRKNLETDEDKEAYRRAIAEKRRELKEKKEQEEKERQERMRLAKIEQAKREEEARRMFEEAAAAAEKEKVLKEEREKEQAEEEKKRLEEENTRKREAAEKLKKEREMQKQKQEDERTARKKRLEMIMRRTRQPDASDSAKTNDDSTPSSATQSPVSGSSPQTQSPVGGKSPLTATTPERSVSPGVAAFSNERGDALSVGQETKTSAGQISENEANLLNFTNSSTAFDASGVELIDIRAAGDTPALTVEKPVPFEAFTTKNIVNGVEGSAGNHNGSDSFNLLSNGSESSERQMIHGNQDLLGLTTGIASQQNLLTEP